MDLLDLDGEGLYYDEPMSADVSRLVQQASECYADGDAELPLLQAYLMAPQSLTVLVALYRYYYYQHRLECALQAARQAMAVSAHRLGIQGGWQTLSIQQLGLAVMRSMGMVRFYLLSLKGAGYLCCRLDRWQEGCEMLQKVVEMDPADRLGADALLQLVLNMESVQLGNQERMVG